MLGAHCACPSRSLCRARLAVRLMPLGSHLPRPRKRPDLHHVVLLRPELRDGHEEQIRRFASAAMPWAFNRHCLQELRVARRVHDHRRCACAHHPGIVSSNLRPMHAQSRDDTGESRRERHQWQPHSDIIHPPAQKSRHRLPRPHACRHTCVRSIMTPSLLKLRGRTSSVMRHQTPVFWGLPALHGPRSPVNSVGTRLLTRASERGLHRNDQETDVVMHAYVT